MDKTEELLTKLVKLKSCGLINMRAEYYGAIFEKFYDDPAEALKEYKELRRAHWTITDLKISTMPLTHFAETYEELAKNKEEKKMLNVDKYREELLEEFDFNRKKVEGSTNLNLSGVDVYFRSIEAVMKRHGGGSTSYFSDDVKWLFSEYEPPLLENGDGLKPGDWIMVRNHEYEEWGRVQFALFHNGWFYCLRGGSNFAQLHLLPLTQWGQARLPEDGE